MILTTDNLISKNHSRINAFTLEDCRDISFSVENKCDELLHDTLISKTTGSDIGVDKFNSLLLARAKFINESLILNNGESNITLNLNIFQNSLSEKMIPIKEKLSIDGIEILMDYPTNLYFKDYDDLIVNCIKQIYIKDKFINFLSLDKSEKHAILDRLNASTIENINNFINKNNKDIVLMESKFKLEPIYINFFNNSAFLMLKTLYSYYEYDSIIEMLFILSKRFNDISFLNTRTPMELDTLIRLYEEENSAINKK
jgi:hypothetical protein